jgi:enoyl-CoA hydratase/carnithine racemase
LAEDLLLVEKAGNIATLTINRPDKRNSMNPEILVMMGDALNSLKDEGQTRVVVIRGTGEKAFSSGFDIGRIGGGGQETPAHPNPLGYGLGSVGNFPFPVIAMIHGYAVGAGLELAMTCDMRIAADTARLGITPAKLGVVYTPQGIRKFLDVIGAAATKELFYTGRIVDVARAREMGLVDYVVPAADLEAITYGLAGEIAANAPLSVSGAKTTIRKLLDSRPITEEDVAELRQLQAEAMASEDLKEGQSAFMEKRKPNFTGR